MFARMGARDLAAIAAVALLWCGAASASAGSGMLADLVGTLLGLGFGVCVFLLHEWGHLLGALATGSVVQEPASLRSAYLFSYDSKRNTQRSFLVMSLGGFAATGLAVALAYGALPDAWLATRVARGATLVLATLTVVVELPLLAYALLRSELPPVEVFPAAREEPWSPRSSA